MKIVLITIAISCTLCLLIYFGSRLQMKAWIDEFNNSILGKHKQLIKEEDDKIEK